MMILPHADALHYKIAIGACLGVAIIICLTFVAVVVCLYAHNKRKTNSELYMHHNNYSKLLHI